jgi:virginiamycin B lyase
LRFPLLVSALVLSVIGAWGQQGTITEYPLTPPSAAGNVCQGPDGNTWFVFTGSSGIGNISSSGAVNSFSFSNSTPLTPSLVGCAFGPDGRLYFSDQNNALVVAFDRATRQFTTFRMPAPNSGIAGLTFGSDGNAWIMVSSSSAIQRMNTSGTFLPVIKLVAGRYPHGPSTCPDGNVWFAEHNANRIAKVDPSGVVTEVVLPQANSLPFSTACGPDGVYFTEEKGRIGRIDYSTLVITQWQTSSSLTRPTGIAIAANGNVYFAENHVSKIGIMAVGGGVIKEFTLPNPGLFPDKLVAGSDGRVWFSQQNLAQIAAVQ